MKLSHLRIVVAVVERGSVRSAARQLGMAQPAISRSIQELERELGVQLFERTKTGMVMTQVGEMVIRRAKMIQVEIQRTLDEVEHFKGQDVGSISIGLSTAAHVAILPKILAPFRKRYPKVRFKLTEGLFPYLEADIRDGLIDIYVGPVPKDRKSDDLIIEHLFENRRIIIARQGHPLAHAASVRDLTDASWVTTPVMPDTENEVNAIYTSIGLPPPNIVAQANSGMSIISVVASSDLLAPMPQQWVDFIARSNLVVQIPVIETTYAPAICVVHLARSPLTPAAQYLKDLIDRAAANHARTLINPALPKVTQG